MLNKIKELAAFAAIAMVGSESLYDERENFKEIKFCGNCVECPKLGKTFCKLAKHNVTKWTPAHNCQYFREPTIKEE